MHRPTPDSPTDRRERRCAGGGTERDAHTPGPFAHHPWPESVAEKVELKSRMIFTSTLISAIDDFRLVRMQRQSAISKPRLKSSPQRRGLVLCAAVANRIVGIALERYVREIPAHPHIERIMKKEIRQERADNPTLRRRQGARHAKAAAEVAVGAIGEAGAHGPLSREPADEARRRPRQGACGMAPPRHSGRPTQSHLRLRAQPQKAAPSASARRPLPVAHQYARARSRRAVAVLHSTRR